MAGKNEVKERKKREKKNVKKRRKKEREEREGDLNYRFLLFGATCIRGDLEKNPRAISFGGFNLGAKINNKSKKIDVRKAFVLRYVF